MTFVTICAVSLLAAAAPLAVADVNSVQPVGFTNNSAVATASNNAKDKDRDKDRDKGRDKEKDSDRVSLQPGNRAPDFQYQSYDAMWQHLHNVLEHGDVLLVFGASDVDLRTLERERESLVKGGVMPLAVVERNDRDVWASVRRLGLTFSLLADPKGAIGTQYGVYDPSLGHSRSAWYLIDVKGRVRQYGGDMPTQGWPALAATALGRPLGGSTQSASKR